MPVLVKVPVETIERENITTVNEVKGFMEQNKQSAYTIMGIMIELYGVKKEDIDDVPFTRLGDENLKMYNRISTALRVLRVQGFVDMAKSGTRIWVYYWVQNE